MELRKKNHYNVSLKDSYDKIKGFLTEDTINYIKEKTDDVWNEIEEIE